LADVGFDQRLGEQIPLELRFTDETGESVTLDRYFGQRPVVLALVYYDCPMLCSMVLNGMITSLRALKFAAGSEFEVVVVSFDPGETAEQARTAKQTYLERYDRPGTEDGWHFLTGHEQAIQALTRSVGFRYVYLPEEDQFAHAAGILALTPEGRVARYFYGVEYAPRDVRLGLIEAADSEIGSMVDQVLLYCFHYDPTTGRYSVVAMNILRLAAGVTIVFLGLFLLRQWRRERRQLQTAKA
jgi:protein SCO1/2